ncbi:hypothetical protein WA158_000829 [Blastocystis sp. Blastoise]
MKNTNYDKYLLVIQNSNYSDIWKKRLTNYFNLYIFPLPFKKFSEFLKNPYSFMDYMVNERKIKISPMKSLCELILFIIRNVSSLNKEGILNKWCEFYVIINAMYEKYLDNKKRTLIQDLIKDGITTPYLHEYHDKLENYNPLRLILDFYSYLPPARADYAQLFILTPEDTIDPAIHKNYIVYDKEKHTGSILLNDYKTAGKYSTIQLDAPKELIEDLELLLKRNPNRKFIFESSVRTGFTTKAFDWFVNKHLKQIHPKLTINALRKLYATTTTNTFQDIENSASALCHNDYTHINSYVSLENNNLFKKLIE